MSKITFHKFIFSLLTVASITISGYARTLYWVGGSGNWNQSSHWSQVSGGNGGAGVPGMNDDVYFDSRSFHNPREVVVISGIATCHSMVWDKDVDAPIFAGASSATLDIYGSFVLTNELDWQYTGTLNFKSTSGGNVMSSYSRTFNCNLCFDGSGSWGLNSFLMLSPSSTLTLASGTLLVNGQLIKCGDFKIKGSGTKVLNADNASIFIKNQIDSSSASNFSYSAKNAAIYFRNEFAIGNFSNFNTPGNHRVMNPVNPVTSITIPSCNCTDTALTHGLGNCCNGKVIISGVQEGNPFCLGHPFKYVWFPGVLNSGPAIYDTVAKNICEDLNFGVVKCTIFDTCDASQTTLIFNMNKPALDILSEKTKAPTCFGDCNGWIIIDSISGGTPNYTYNWSAGKPPGSQVVGAHKRFLDTGLCVTPPASYYYIIITDAHHCRDSLGYFLSEPKAITPTVTVLANVQCFGQTNGSASVTASGGHTLKPYTYLWNPSGQTNTTATGLSAGTYTVTVTDDSLCTGTATVTITQPPLLTISQKSQTNVTCNGQNNGSACVTVTGGTPAYTYAWSPGLTQTTPCVNGLGPSPPVYTVTVTDAHGCTTSASFNITQPSTLADNFTITSEVSCNGGCNGAAQVAPTGGSPPYTYSWAPGLTQTTPTVSGLCASPPNYTVTVTDANGCISSTQFTITQPPALNITITKVDELCNLKCTGTATASVTGGTPGYNYLWSNGKTTSGITALCAGSYTVTVTDSHGCTGTAAVTITQPPPITITTTQVNVDCNGNCDGSATASASGGTPGYNYLWSNGKTTSGITALCAGGYTVTVTDKNGCTATAAVTITQPPQPLSVSLTAIPNPLACHGNSNATITSTVNGGTAPYGYLWRPGGQITPSISGQSAGTYTLVVTDAHGCKDSATITISQPALLTANISAKTDVKCNGASTGSATVTAAGGTVPYGYSWSPSGGNGSTATGLSAGTYTATVTDKNGCTATAVVTITEPPLLTVTINSTNVKCNGACNGTATASASGGTPGYNYVWSNGKTTSGITALCPGGYTVTATDKNGCTATAAVTITEPAPLSVFISSTTSSCNICNGSAVASVTGGTPAYNYLWTPGGQTNSTATGLCVGTYTITVTDANGCTASATATIVPTVKINVTTSGNTVDCFNQCDGVASANPSGGANPYTYSWMPGGQTTQTITGLCPGGYTVTVKDANNCTTIDSARIGNPPQLKPSVSQNNVSCVGKCDGSASATATGGTGAYTYSWAPGGETTSSITGLCAGSYTVTVTDGKGCDSAVVVNITSGGNINDNPTINNEPSCGLSNGSITLNPTGGSAPYFYSWAPGGQSSATVTGLSAGTYTVTITDNAGCQKVFLVLLNNVAGPTLTATNTGVTCVDTCDGSATVSVTAGAGPFTYAWSNGKTTTTITALCAGVYACSVTDKNGCTTNISDTVKDPVPISPNATVQNIACNSPNPTGKITLAPTGGTGPYTYLWSPGGQTTSTISGLSAGTYTVTMHDNVRCDTVIDYTITEPPALTVTITSTNIQCNGFNNGSATAHPAGGTPGYIYNWQPGGAITPTDVNLSAGTYTVTVTDANGCTATAQVTISQPPPLNVTIKPIEVSCNLGNDGGAATTVTGGTPAYTYNWSNGETSDSLKNVSFGTYYLTVTDANGCTYFDSVTITQPAAMVITFTNVNVTCNGSCNGTSKANVVGGTAPYAYSWSTIPVQTNQTATGLCAGSYTVTVTDKNGCTAGNSVTITEPAALDGNPTATSTSCGHTCDGTLTASPTGGTGAYTYKWLPGGQTSSSINNLCGGFYTLVVTDANGCSDSDKVTVPIPPPIKPNPSTSPSNCNTNNGSISLAPTGGTGPYNYVWTPPVSTTSSATGLSAGIYTVQITDAKGCDSIFSILLNSTGGVSSFTNHTLNEPCFGDAIGYIDVTPSGGTQPYTYFWNNLPPPAGQNTDSIYNLKAGTYTLMVTDSNGCVQFDSVLVTQPAALSNQVVIANANCSGVCTGSISLTTSGGTSPYTYSWSNSMTTSSITGLCPGSYTDTLKDAHGCTLIQTFAVGANVIITVNTSSTNIACSGASTGTASATASGGGGTYNYSWSPGLQTNQTATGLSVGTYTVTVTDQNGCQGTATASITSPAALTINLAITPDSCHNSCDGRIIAIVSGGVPPYNYLWGPGGGTTDSIRSLCSGTYSVTVTDKNGCVTSAMATLINPPVFTESHTLTEPTCNTTDNGVINIIPAGGISPYTYKWSPNGLTSSSASNLSEGTYTITVIDSTGCTLNDIVTLTADTTVIAFAGNDTSICAGTPFITLNGSKSTPPGSITYQWFQLPGMSPLGNTAIITITTPLVTTTYMLVAKDGACSDTSKITVTIMPVPMAQAGPDQYIFVYNSVQIGSSPAAGLTYRWRPPTGLNDTTIANPMASPVLTTTYTVFVTNSLGCTSWDTVTVFILPQIVIWDGFTPNGDGQNDVWDIGHISEFPNAVVEIYNRWGELLYHTIGYYKPWDGTYNGEPVPVGTYYYIINLHDPRFKKSYTGPVTIQR